MKSQTLAANKPSKSGQLIMELPITLSLMSLSVGGLLATFLLLVTKVWLETESYALARAHLYGNDQHICQLSGPWISDSWLEKRVECSGYGKISSQVFLHSPWLRTSRPILSSRYDLMNEQGEEALYDDLYMGTTTE